MKIVEARGGAQVGYKSVSWPFARLTATKKELRLKVKLIGKYSFKPSDITELEVVSILPIMGRGIRIHHAVPDYPTRLIFWTLTNPKDMISKIMNSDFNRLQREQ